MQITLYLYVFFILGCGSHLSMAPEIMGRPSKGKYNAEKVDIYSLGILLYYMLFGVFQ